MTTAHAIRIRSQGDPSVLRLEAVELPPPAAGEVQLRQTAIGFNFIDILQRQGTYPLTLPSGLGHEAAGVVEAVGPGVGDFRVGDRVAYINAGLGAYADRRNVAADALVPVPDGVTDEAAAAVIFKAFTAWYLLHRTYAVQPGDVVLVHAAAGGVGLILVAWAKALGATVIGTAGGPEKCARAVAAGCEACIDYTRADWPEQVIAAAGGRKARVVYDSVGRETFLKSLDCTAPFGMVVLYGAASGPPADLDLNLLSKKGCLYVTRPTLFMHAATPEGTREGCAAVFAALQRGAFEADIGARFALADVAGAHAAVASRATTGAVVLVP